MLSWLLAVAEGKKVLLPIATLPLPVVMLAVEEAPMPMFA